MHIKYADKNLNLVIFPAVKSTLLNSNNGKKIIATYAVVAHIANHHLPSAA